MDCEAVNRGELVEKYLQGKLDSARQDEFETHVLECAQCAQEVEVLQAVRRDLTERAHEIRGWTAPKPLFFRWQTVAIAALVVMVIAGSIIIRQKKQSNTAAVQRPPGANQPPLQTAAQQPGTDRLNVPLKPEGEQQAGLNMRKDEVASASVPRKIDNLPINGRDYTHFKLPSRDSAPSIGPAPTNGSEKGTKSASLGEVRGDGKAAADHSVAGQKTPTQIVEEKPKPAPSPSDNVGKSELTTAQGVEAFRLGTVEAAPFSFAGIASHAKDPKGGKTSTFGGKVGASNTGRVLFQDGMTAYVDGHYHEATGFLRSALQYEPLAADVNFYLGVCRILDGHPEESILPLQSAIVAGNSPYLESAHYYMGKAYVQQLNLAAAESEFREAAKLPGPFSTDSKAVLARVAALREQIEQK
jgi:hypothetical protein